MYPLLAWGPQGRGCGQKVGPGMVRIGVRMQYREVLEDGARRLRESGMGYREVAERLGVSKHLDMTWKSSLPPSEPSGM